MKDLANLNGARLQAKGKGSFLAAWKLVQAAVNCVFNHRYLVPTYDADGNYIGTREGVTVYSPSGAVTTFPKTSAGGAGIGGVVRFFKGAGAPSSSTLSADYTYVSISTSDSPDAPDHYYDITDPSNPSLWVCTTDGSNSTSVWYNLSGC